MNVYSATRRWPGFSTAKPVTQHGASPICTAMASSDFRCGTISPPILLKRESRSVIRRKPSAVDGGNISCDMPSGAAWSWRYAQADSDGVTCGSGLSPTTSLRCCAAWVRSYLDRTLADSYSRVSAPVSCPPTSARLFRALRVYF